MYCSAIVLAAGCGARLKSKTPKPLVKLNGLPVILYSLKTFGELPQVKEIIVVVNPSNKKEIIRIAKYYSLGKVKEFVLGGKARQDSVRQGLAAVSNCADLILIHDAARPFVDKKTISGVITRAKNCGAAIIGVPVKCTIKEAHGSWLMAHKGGVVKKTLDRNKLWEIQTPQVFNKDLILAAFKRFGRKKVTDDAMLIEKLGKKVNIVEGSYNNIKITTPEDLLIAEAIARNLFHTRCGRGK